VKPSRAIRAFSGTKEPNLFAVFGVYYEHLLLLSIWSDVKVDFQVRGRAGRPKGDKVPPRVQHLYRLALAAKECAAGRPGGRVGEAPPKE